MKDFFEWLQSEGLGQNIPNLGQQAIPIQNNQPQQAGYVKPQQGQPQQGQQVSLNTMAPKITDQNWHSLHDVFTRQFQRQPNDPQVGQLGQALYQSAQTKNMSSLQPFTQKYLQAQPAK